MNQTFEEWDELNNDFKQLEIDNKTYIQHLDQLTNLQKKCQSHLTHQRYRLDIIQRTLKELEKTKDKEKHKEDEEKIKELESNILKRKAQLHEVEQTLPKPNGIYLKIILGNVNVSILNKEEKYVDFF
ncbi:unnamed protein product [Acanthoscelides obtectus]|uniref:Uncharacterized protein n=1 Tax=Acanthoscelides obtectus TaxID=200917 RepID=A0A9P0JVI8_ACAOB|nr:unnamed protein product [Acanthoscelides obtectus]CAK1667242.1 Transmembrane protein 120 homolog [Acanthoscelides obtectus]